MQPDKTASTATLAALAGDLLMINVGGGHVAALNPLFALESVSP